MTRRARSDSPARPCSKAGPPRRRARKISANPAVAAGVEADAEAEEGVAAEEVTAMAEAMAAGEDKAKEVYKTDEDDFVRFDFRL